jgi:F-type H+-transporting ATPase subunit b
MRASVAMGDSVLFNMRVSTKSFIRFLANLAGLFLLSACVLGSSSLADEEKSPAEKDATTHASGDTHAAGHGHDDMDNTHKDAPADMESPDSIRLDKTLFTLVVFLLLLGGLYLVAWNPIMEGLSKREADINTLIANTEKASADAAAKLREYELKLQAAAQEAQSMIAQARKDAEASGQRIIADSQAEAARQKGQALAEIESAKRVAIAELSSKSTELAFTLAKRIVGRELRAEDHQQLVADVLSQFPSRN